MGYQQESESGDPLGRPLPHPPSTKKKTRKKTKKGVGRCYSFFFYCIDTLPIAPVGLVFGCRCSWPCCCSTSSCCYKVCPPPLLVCRVDQCIDPGPEFGDSSIPAGNCGPISSDVYVLDRHVRILYEFMFYIYCWDPSGTTTYRRWEGLWFLLWIFVFRRQQAPL
jgi:hypothetical protein